MSAIKSLTKDRHSLGDNKATFTVTIDKQLFDFLKLLARINKKDLNSQIELIIREYGKMITELRYPRAADTIKQRFALE